MVADLDLDAIEAHGWRQGAVLGRALLGVARDRAPTGCVVLDSDWLIVTSHDCDVVNGSLEKEPLVEILRAAVTGRREPEKQQVWGRNPRTMQLAVADEATEHVLQLRVHERWTLPRESLAMEAPVRILPEKAKRLIAEWLAKRYIRAAFPSEFDRRWRSKMRDWTTLLEKHSPYLQGVYLRLNSQKELDSEQPYRCDFIIAYPITARSTVRWATLRFEIQQSIEEFWSQFSPTIECTGVEVLGTDELTLADIELYQRFDADWVSFADESEIMPSIVDMTT